MRKILLSAGLIITLFKLGKTYDDHNRTMKEEHSFKTSQIG